MPRRTQAQRTAETRERLGDAVIATLADSGYSGASTTVICKRAGVSRGAMQHHFPSRADLMAAAVQHLFEVRHAEFQQAIAELGSSPAPVRAVLLTLWDIYSGPTLEAWMELVVAGRGDDELRARLRDVDEAFFAGARQTCAQMLALRGEPVPDDVITPFARMVLAFFDGLALNRAVRDDPEEREAAIALFQRLVLQWLESV